MHYLVKRGRKKEKEKKKERRREEGTSSDLAKGRDFATPSPSVCPAEESQEETSVASMPGTADVTPDDFEEKEMDSGVPWTHGANAPPMALQEWWFPPGPPQGPPPQGLQQGPPGPLQQGPPGPLQQGPQHGPQGLQQGLQHGRQGEGLQDVGSTAPQAVHAAGELQGGDQAEPADEPASGLPDDGPRRGESDEVPRPTIFTAAFGTVYHVRPSCGKLRCASRRLAHAGRCSVVG